MAEDFITKLQGDLHLQSPHRAECLAAATLSTLRETLTSPQAAAIELALPKELQAYWVGDRFQHGYRDQRRAEIWRADLFFERVGRLGEIRDPQVVEDVVRTVFQRFQEMLDDQNVEFLASRLPDKIRLLWVEGAPTRR
jgi:uncharacterized protein (DUF2267 family)